MAKRKQYTDEFRASAVLMLASQGWPDRKGSLTKVANHLSIHPRTLSRWANGENNPPPDKVVNSKKRDMLSEIESLQYLILGEMHNAVEDAPLNQLATSYGILTDKHRLLSGESTDNNAVKIQITYADN